MNNIGEFSSMNEAYPELCQYVQTWGTWADPGGKRCCELRPTTFNLFQPGKALYNGILRRLNIPFFVVETLSYFAGWGNNTDHAELMVRANKRHQEFVQPNGLLIPMTRYGVALAQCLERGVDELIRDPDSRRVVLPIWSPNTLYGRNDAPCTVSLSLFRSTNHGNTCLSMLAHMRSNDLNWGTPYDVAAFCMIQCVIAEVLGWQLGTYTHVTNSLHYYKDTPPRILNKIDLFEHPELYLPVGFKGSISDFMNEAAIFLSELVSHKDSFETFESDLLKSKPYWKQWENLVRWKWPR